MTIGRQHAMPRPQIFLDGLGLGGRLYDDEFHIVRLGPLCVRTRVGSRPALRQAARDIRRITGPGGKCADQNIVGRRSAGRSEEHTSELQSLMRISYAVLCLKKK